MEWAKSAASILQYITSNLSEAEQIEIHQGLGEHIQRTASRSDTVDSTSLQTSCVDYDNTVGQIRHATKFPKNRISYSGTVVSQAEPRASAPKKRHRPDLKDSGRKKLVRKSPKELENDRELAVKKFEVAYQVDGLSNFSGLWTDVSASHCLESTITTVQHRLVADDTADQERCTVRTRLRAMLLLLDHDITGDLLVDNAAHMKHADYMLEVGRKFIDYARCCGLGIALRLIKDRPFWMRITSQTFKSAYERFKQTVESFPAEKRKSWIEMDVKYQQKARSLLQHAARMYGVLHHLENGKHDLSRLYRGERDEENGVSHAVQPDGNNEADPSNTVALSHTGQLDIALIERARDDAAWQSQTRDNQLALAVEPSTDTPPISSSQGRQLVDSCVNETNAIERIDSGLRTPMLFQNEEGTSLSLGCGPSLSDSMWDYYFDMFEDRQVWFGEVFAPDAI